MTVNDILALGKMGFTAAQVQQMISLERAQQGQPITAPAQSAAAPAAQQPAAPDPMAAMAGGPPPAGEDPMAAQVQSNGQMTPDELGAAAAQRDFAAMQQ